MDDTPFEQQSAAEASLEAAVAPPEDAAPPEDVPRFGAVDIVEAFTAMRHEWRGQTKESRALAEQIQAATAHLQALESKLLASVADQRPADAPAEKQLVLVIVETDHQLTRAAAALEQWEAHQRQRSLADAQALERYFAGMNRLARWFARPLLDFLSARNLASPAAVKSPAVEGLDMVLARLRRMLHEQGIERLDVHRQPFDASTMHAIGSAATTDCPAGHVAEQLSPAYRWRGQIIRFADVRVATSSLERS